MFQVIVYFICYIFRCNEYFIFIYFN